ncbi:MAG: LysR family transcriptional regulator [Steroidobacteraceae bacterium]|jgi:DNA-binding transcriptional LysR family regulator
MGVQAPDWHLFRGFLAVVREGSLSRAARILGTTQPTMGRQVAALEALLGVKLFNRMRDGLVPTEAGLRLIPSVEAMSAAAEAAQRAASGEVEDERGTVRITASVVVGSEVLPSILAEIHSMFPRISLELALSNRNEDLLRGDADIAVRMVRPTQGALVAKLLGRIDIGLYAHRRYLKGRTMPRRLEDLSHHVMIGYDRELAYAQLLERLGLPPTPGLFGFRSDSEIAQLAALRAGFGIAPCQLGIARRDKNLVPVLHSAFIYPMEVWLAMHRDSRASRRIRLLFDQLVPRLSAYARGSCLETQGLSRRWRRAGN